MNNEINLKQADNQTVFYVGIDVHRKKWVVTIRAYGMELRTVSMNPSPKELADHLHRNYTLEVVSTLSMKSVFAAFGFITNSNHWGYQIVLFMQQISQPQIKRRCINGIRSTLVNSLVNWKRGNSIPYTFLR